MTAINQDLIKAREVVAGYKELNKCTIEEVSYYDPILKLRRYKKVSIDPNSKDFIKIYGKKKNEKEKQGKPIKVVEVKIPKPKPKVISKPKKVAKPRYVKVTERKKRGFNTDSRASKIYDMHLLGKNNAEIAKELNIEQHYVSAQLLYRKKSLGIPTSRKKKVNQGVVLKLFKLGKSVDEIADELNVTNSCIYGYLRAEKTEEQKELEREDVLKHIHAKMKLNQKDHIFGKMITPMKCKYKYDISIMDVYKYCNELAEQGKIIIPDEKLMKHKGRKIELPIA